MAQNNEDNYVLIATKLSPAAHARLEMIARRRKMSKYELIQMVCDVLIRYCDKAHNLSREIELVMAVFEHMIGWDGCFNVADPTATPEIVEATYYLTAEGKKGVRAVHVERPFFGEWTQNFNVQDILEKTICLLMPERYKRMRQVAVDTGATSLLQLLDEMIDTYTQAADMDAIREEFEDADRSEWGIKPVKQPFKKRKGNKNELLFTDEDEEGNN